MPPVASAAAAALNHVDAQYQLGLLMMEGEGVEHDMQKAALCFYAAAMQGHVYSQYNLAIMYEEGIGVEQNPEMAVKFYKAAARQGLVQAKKALQEMGF